MSYSIVILITFYVVSFLNFKSFFFFYFLLNGLISLSDSCSLLCHSQGLFLFFRLLNQRNKNLEWFHMSDVPERFWNWFIFILWEKPVKNETNEETWESLKGCLHWNDLNYSTVFAEFNGIKSRVHWNNGRRTLLPIRKISFTKS